MKKKKNSMLTIGAFAIVGILVVGTIIGVIMTQTSKGNNTSSEEGGLIPLVTTEPAVSGSGVTDELQTDEQADKDNTQQKDEADDNKSNNNTKTGDNKSSDKSSKTTKKPTKTAKPKNNKSDDDNTDNNTDQGLTDQKPSGKDNEISFSDFE